MDAKTIIDYWVSRHPAMAVRGLMSRMKSCGGSLVHIARHLAIEAGGSESSAWDEAVGLVRGALENGSVALCGPRGTGKSQLAHLFLAEMCLPPAWNTDPTREDYNEPRYVLLSDLSRRLRATFAKDSETTEFAEVSKLTRSPLLIIDELQDGSGTGFQEQTLTDLIAERYRHGRPTIFCANVTPENLVAALGPSIVDRFQEGTSGMVECQGKSLRGNVGICPKYQDLYAEITTRIEQGDEYNPVAPPSRMTLRRHGVDVRGPMVPPPPAPPSLSTDPEPEPEGSEFQ